LHLCRQSAIVTPIKQKDVMTYQLKREPLIADEANRLRNACETFEEKLIVWTLLDTGLRVGELVSLTKDNILWQEKAIRVLGKGGPYGKQSKRRVVPMSDAVLALLSNYFATHNKWFVQKRRVQQIVKEIANRAQIIRPVSPHILRHTFACTADQRGISLATLQKIMGHDHLTTTQQYLNFTDSQLVEEFRKKW
jgi:integrase/recombinase XerD